MLFIRWTSRRRSVRSGCARSWRTSLIARLRWCAVKHGRVNQFTGDGIMAWFGAPTALEDHAFRACLAVLDVQREMESLSAEVHQRDGVVVQLRIGLNSGHVITGDVSSTTATYTA